VAKIEGREKRAKGLIKYRGKWGTPSEVERWKLEDFEKEQRAKGLVKYRNEWIPKLEAKRRFEAEQRAKGLVKFVDRHRRERWGTPEQVREWKRIDLGMQNNFEDLSPREFEEFIAKLFRVMGYQVELTPQVRDLGADIVARKGGDTIVVQVKKYSVGHNVSNREVQQTLGSMWKFKANKSVIITTSDFTVLAQEQAKGAPIELWNRETLFNLIEKYLLSL
jgi:restriction system protein